MARTWRDAGRPWAGGLISYERPGYGGSSPQPGRTVADCAGGPSRAICAELGIDRLAMWGISGGGPATCSRALPCSRTW